VHTRPVTPAASPEVTSTAPATLDAASTWNRFKNSCAANPSVSAVIEPLMLERIDGTLAYLSAPSAESLSMVKPRKAAIEELLGKLLGRTMRIELKLAADAASLPEPAAARQPAGIMDPDDRAAALKNPLVKRAIELFDARLIDVQDDPN